MIYKFSILVILFGTLTGNLLANKIKGQVKDSDTKQPLSFATIKAGATNSGTVADLNGFFELDNADNAGYIEVSYLGYQSQVVKLLPEIEVLNILLAPNRDQLQEVVIKPQDDKVRGIINLAIANRVRNDPDKYDWYQCHVYYKMIADIVLPDTILHSDTSVGGRTLKKFTDSQHLIMSETYSVRTWKRPQLLQEEILASRFSGLKKSSITGLVTDVLPFHSYKDYLMLNGVDYHNPVSPGSFLHYKFNLKDELIQGNDTLWVISFYPKKGQKELRGVVYINSNGYAISSLSAHTYDKLLNRTVGINQEYQFTGGKWFPKQLNYKIEWQQKQDSIKYTIRMLGNSMVDSVKWIADNGFHFDKTHTVKLSSTADEYTDSSWAKLRPIALNNKEIRTYKFDDSLMEVIHFDKILNVFRKLPEGKISIGMVDVDLKRLLGYSYYEGLRLGLGLQTNEHLVKWLSVGGWGGYGFGDKEWKYGYFAEVYADKYKEFLFRIAFDKDIQAPGNLMLNKALDKNYLSAFFLRRADVITGYNALVKKKIGYWTFEAKAAVQNIMPKYGYSYQIDRDAHQEYNAKELSINAGYAFGERTAPVMGYYYPLYSGLPILYGKLLSGTLKSGSFSTNYTQALAAIQWNKHINRLGFEHFIVEAGKCWSEKPLPLSKDFAVNGYRFDNEAIYMLGGMMTIYPNQYFTDQFVSGYFRHDFDWKFYHYNIPHTKLSSSPSLGIGYNFVYGSMNQPEVHKNISFSIPVKGYHEAGLLLDNLLKIVYANTYYYSIAIGYFYHFDGELNANNGRFVFGVGFEL